MSTGSIGGIGQSAQQGSSGSKVLRDVSMDDFLKLLITELRNQDPLDPMSNQEMLEQIGQIRAIESNERLTETLEAVQLGQSMATAGSLIGRTIEAMTSDGRPVSGRVEQVSIEHGLPKLHIGDEVVELKNLGAILADSEEMSPEETDAS